MKKNKKLGFILFISGLVLSQMAQGSLAVEAEVTDTELLAAWEFLDDTYAEPLAAGEFFEDTEDAADPAAELFDALDFFGEGDEEFGEEAFPEEGIKEGEGSEPASGDFIFEEYDEQALEESVLLATEGDGEDSGEGSTIPIVGVENILHGLNDDDQIVVGAPVTFEYADLMSRNSALNQVLKDGGETTVGIRKSTGETLVLEPNGSTYSISALEDERLSNVCYWITVTVQATGEIYESNIPFYVCPFKLVSLTLEVEGQGTATADKYWVTPGDHIELTFTPDEGWYLDSWDAVSNWYTLVSGKENTISIGDNTVIKVVFKEIVQTGSCGPDAAFSFDTKTGVLTISGTGAISNNAFFNDEAHAHEWDAVTSVVIEKGITEIGKYAFYRCTGLVTVSLPEGLTEIGANAFNVCKNLETVTLPQSLLKIQDGAFSQCYVLSNITLPDNLEVIGNNAFLIADLREVTVPSTVTYLGTNVFNSNENLVTAVINAEIKTLPMACFSKCYALKNVTLPETLEKIDAYAFQYCESLKTVDIPESVTVFDKNVFTGCRRLERITIPKDVAGLSEWMFAACKSLTDVSLPENLKTIGRSTFEGCEALQSIVIPQNVTLIDYRAFGSCKKLSQINLPSGLTKIYDTCFTNCPALTFIDIPEGVTEIEYGAFQNTGLTGIVLPNSLEKIGESAFYMGDKGKMLGTLTIPASVKEIGRCAFYRSDFSTIVNLSSQSFTLSDILRSTSFPSEAINIYLDSEGEEVETIKKGTYTKKVSEDPGDDPGSGGSGDPDTGETENPGSGECVHSWSEITKKATLTANGGIYRRCSKCQAEEVVVPFAMVSRITLKTASYVYDGKAKKPAVEVKNAFGDVLAADQYTVTYSNNVNAGTATVKVTLSSKWYEGSKNLTFRIGKAANPLTVKAKTASVKYAKVRKKAQTLALSKVMSFTAPGKGSMKYQLSSAKKGSKSFKKYFKVNGKTGKVTVKKGLKKGSYKVTVNIVAAGDANYMPAAKALTFKVKVK